MTELFLVLLRILFPLDPVARLREITREYLNWLVTCLEDPAKLNDFLTNPEACAGVEAHVIVIEHGVQLLINERARQIAGLPFIYTERLKLVRLHRAKPPRKILARLNRAAALFDNLERLAHRRAKRMQREHSENPLRLDASHRSTSPALRAVEANHHCLAALSAQHWGRWIGASWRRDEGGLFAQPRGPPNFPTADFRNPTPEAQLPGTHPLDLPPSCWPARPMRMILLTAALAFAACSEKPPEPETPTAAAIEPTTAIIAAERAFAADGAITGWVEAFERWSEPDAIVLGDGPTPAKQFLANIDPANRGDTSLHWAPEFAGASAAGDFGFTTGPFNGDGAAFGYYFTVWRKQANGDWRWIYDGGVDTQAPTTIDPAFNVATIAPSSGGEETDRIARVAVATLEAGLAVSAAIDAPASLAAQFAPIARMHRQDQPPAIGNSAIAAALGNGPAQITFSQITSYASANGDMVFTLGDATWDGGKGIYGRIWSHGAKGWRIVFDQIVLR